MECFLVIGRDKASAFIFLFFKLIFILLLVTIHLSLQPLWLQAKVMRPQWKLDKELGGL